MPGKRANAWCIQVDGDIVIGLWSEGQTAQWDAPSVAYAFHTALTDAGVLRLTAEDLDFPSLAEARAHEGELSGFFIDVMLQEQPEVSRPRQGLHSQQPLTDVLLTMPTHLCLAFPAGCQGWSSCEPTGSTWWWTALCTHPSLLARAGRVQGSWRRCNPSCLQLPYQPPLRRSRCQAVDRQLWPLLPQLVCAIHSMPEFITYPVCKQCKSANTLFCNAGDKLQQESPGAVPQAAPPRPPPPPPPGRKRGVPPPKALPPGPADANRAAGAVSTAVPDTGRGTAASAPGVDRAPEALAPTSGAPRFRTLHWTKALVQVCT